ncbi:MAG TPA: hypothetical protein VEZ14_06035 [Dehalococcoidia bacterium]|nr:hypothetical protein [Dehalococcoidia bacterium]
MKTKTRIAGIALLVVAALEFGLLGANAAGLTGHSGPGHDGPSGPGERSTATAVPVRGTPASIQITPDPLEVTCDPSHSETLTVRLTDARGAVVADGTRVLFQSYGVAQPQPAEALTKRGIATTQLRPTYAPAYDTTIDVRVQAGALNVVARIPCRGACPISPPAGSPPCVPPTPPVSPPPCGSSSPPSVSPPCATATPIVGPTLSIRAAGLGVTLVASGAGFSPYNAYNYVLAYDPAQVHIAAWQNDMSPSTAFCLTSSLSTSVFDFGCTLLGPATTVATGDLGTISLTPATTAPLCARLHLRSFGPPDGGDAIDGTYTVDAQSYVPQRNPYGTVTLSIPVNGGSCGGGSATATATGTPAPSATATPTP